MIYSQNDMRHLKRGSDKIPGTLKALKRNGTHCRVVKFDKERILWSALYDAKIYKSSESVWEAYHDSGYMQFKANDVNGITIQDGSYTIFLGDATSWLE